MNSIDRTTEDGHKLTLSRDVYSRLVLRVAEWKGEFEVSFLANDVTIRTFLVTHNNFVLPFDYPLFFTNAIFAEKELRADRPFSLEALISTPVFYPQTLELTRQTILYPDGMWIQHGGIYRDEAELDHVSYPDLLRVTEKAARERIWLPRGHYVVVAVNDGDNSDKLNGDNFEVVQHFWGEPRLRLVRVLNETKGIRVNGRVVGEYDFIDEDTEQRVETMKAEWLRCFHLTIDWVRSLPETDLRQKEYSLDKLNEGHLTHLFANQQYRNNAGGLLTWEVPRV